MKGPPESFLDGIPTARYRHLDALEISFQEDADPADVDG